MSIAGRASEHKSRASAALSGRRWDVAETELRAYLVFEPTDAIAWNNLGVALERQHRDREAVVAYARAFSLLPNGKLPAQNLVRKMQGYLGFVAALAIFRIVEFGAHFLPVPPDLQTAITIVALVALFVGALALYIRRRDELPQETWHAYKSEMARTRRLRYGGLAFVLGGFLVFAVVLFLLILVPAHVDDGTVVLVIIAGFCWLIVARIVWRRLIRPFFEARMP